MNSLIKKYLIESIGILLSKKTKNYGKKGRQVIKSRAKKGRSAIEKKLKKVI